MQTANCRVSRWLPLLAAAGLLAVLPRPAAAKRPIYWFAITGVQAGKDVAPALGGRVEKEVASQLSRHDRLVGKLPADAPDPGEARFKQYLRARNMRAFRVNVEITAYDQRIEALPHPRQGHHVAVRLALRMLGETIPDRSIAFTGDGASSIKIEVGRRIRPRDREIADQEAIGLAVRDALAESIREIEAGPRPRAQ